eukprot:TRINITY_DN23130_c0_g3_i1.p1 TRINITY_DN23130_c0_g3~~TRINITY_DN23130_c0_g3_i1.p1  ORF type:complete len:1128 (+),score=91.47 TRINITY_DN23130_c0_g3_i1:458-3385(+)
MILKRWIDARHQHIVQRFMGSLAEGSAGETFAVHEVWQSLQANGYTFSAVPEPLKQRHLCGDDFFNRLAKRPDAFLFSHNSEMPTSTAGCDQLFFRKWLVQIKSNKTENESAASETWSSFVCVPQECTGEDLDHLVSVAMTRINDHAQTSETMYLSRECMRESAYGSRMCVYAAPNSGVNLSTHVSLASISGAEYDSERFLVDPTAESQPGQMRPTVVFVARGQSDAYWEHIAATALAVDAIGSWRVVLLGAKQCYQARQHSEADLRRLEQLDREEVDFAAELTALRNGVSSQDRPLVVVLHYGWIPPSFGLGLRPIEQVSEPTRHIFVTTFETDRPPIAIVSLARRMDEVWTTCYNNAEDLRAHLAVDQDAAPQVHDVPEAMPVLPASEAGYVEDAASRRAIAAALLPNLPSERSAVFLFMKRMTYDTGWDVLLRAFVREFPPGPKSAYLIMKLGYDGGSGLHARRMVKEALASCRDCPSALPSNVFVLARRLNDTEISALFDLADAYVEPTRAVGCMSVSEMQMMMQGRVVIGPSMNFCSRCRVSGGRDGTGGVFTVRAVSTIPAYCEVYQDFPVLSDLLDSDFVEPDENDLRSQLRRFADTDSAERASLGAAASLAMKGLVDRTSIGTAVVARLDALLNEHVARGSAAQAPRLTRRWSPKLHHDDGTKLARAQPHMPSWVNHLPHERNHGAVANALNAQFAIGRLASNTSKAQDLRGILAESLSKRQWTRVRDTAETLYRTERSPQILLHFATACLHLKQVEAALAYVEWAWELTRRPHLRDGHSLQGKVSPQQWADLTKRIVQMHCDILRELPEPALHYEYVEHFGIPSDCAVSLMPKSAELRADAHASMAHAYIKGTEKWTNFGYTPSYTLSAQQQTLADRYLNAAQHFGNALVLRPENGSSWRNLVWAVALHRLAAFGNISGDFLRRLLLMMRHALALSPNDAAITLEFKDLAAGKVPEIWMRSQTGEG